jgi:hypothetical protein
MVLEPIRERRHTVEPCQVIEQRIARRRHHHGVSGIVAEQFEQDRVGLARAGRQHDALRGHADAAARVVAGHRRARGRKAQRRRFVAQGLAIGQRVEQGWGILDTGGRGVRQRQVEQVPSGRPKRPQHLRDAVRFEVAGNA